MPEQQMSPTAEKSTEQELAEEWSDGQLNSSAVQSVMNDHELGGL